MLNEKQLSRITFWTNPNAAYADANIKATSYGKPAKYPEALLSEEAAIESLRGIVGQLKVIDSKFGGECSLSDNNIRKGEQIYFGTIGYMKFALRKSDIDAILA